MAGEFFPLYKTAEEIQQALVNNSVAQHAIGNHNLQAAYKLAVAIQNLIYESDPEYVKFLINSAVEEIDKI